MSPREEFLLSARSAAADAGHIWPEYAACEAALESRWGESRLARDANNLLGQKQAQATAHYPTLNLLTDEWDAGRRALVKTGASWPIFPDWVVCFRERMKLLKRVKAYAGALKAPSGADFVRLVSRAWATDPKRADKVLLIYQSNRELLEEAGHAA